MEYICQFGFDNHDILEVLISVEKALHIRMPGRSWGRLFSSGTTADMVTLGDMVRFLAQNREQFLQQKESKSNRKV
jgi:acyl carrier protein